MAAKKAPQGMIDISEDLGDEPIEDFIQYDKDGRLIHMPERFAAARRLKAEPKPAE